MGVGRQAARDEPGAGRRWRAKATRAAARRFPASSASTGGDGSFAELSVFELAKIEVRRRSQSASVRAVLARAERSDAGASAGKADREGATATATSASLRPCCGTFAPHRRGVLASLREYRETLGPDRQSSSTPIARCRSPSKWSARGAWPCGTTSSSVWAARSTTQFFCR